jgi:hypothetical protein
LIPAYVLRKNSQLSFWHEQPQVNDNAFNGEAVGEYYMTFFDKANYPGPFDGEGIPLLDYHGVIGRQYNPIAIAQYGLGHYNLYRRNSNTLNFDKFKKSADWLVDNLEPNSFGLYVWNHKFDWEYFRTLKAPWYSALAQGQGISVLVRAFVETGNDKYLGAARKAFVSLSKGIDEGGVMFVDKDGDIWLEEYLVEPASHVLNGFIWALWGINDYYRLMKEQQAQDLYQKCLETIRKNLHRYDNGFWSLYDLSQNRIRTIASYFYHNLHIIQLQVLGRLSGDSIFEEYSLKWEDYRAGRLNRYRALCTKSVFKLFYY